MKTFKEFIKEEINSTEVNGHPMIDVDGEMKHVNNSMGQPIHPTEEGIRNFHKWFGKSKLVDEHGRPKVMFHGTSSDIPKFDLSYAGKGNDQYGSGFYLSHDPNIAGTYTSSNSVHTQNVPNIIPTYVSIKKPLDIESEKPLSAAHIHALITSAPNHKETLEDNYGDVSRNGYSRVLRDAANTYADIPAYHAMNSMHNDFYNGHTEDFLKNFKAITKYDGININGGEIVNAFTPNQIKSSTGNKGKFSKRKDELTESTEHPLIDVDGEMKHKNNSEGQPIHPTDEGIRNFHRWFGSSSTVDEHGRPQVMYTGTSKDADFKHFNVPKNGTWFTKDKNQASSYAIENDSKDMKYDPDTRSYQDINTASRVIPTYIRAHNTYTMTPEDNAKINVENYKRAQGQFFDTLRAKGHDSINFGNGVFTVIGNPTQIKSAIGNTGKFNQSKKPITESN